MQNQSLIEAIIKKLTMHDYGLESQFIKCVTTLHMLDPNETEKISFRADPYFHKRPWHDWCISNWEISGSNINDDDTSGNNHFPSQILMIIDTKNMQFNSDLTRLGRYLAVVKATELNTRSNKDR